MTDYHTEPLRRSNCGTNAGFNQHALKRERACEPCREANRIYLNVWHIRTGRYNQRRVSVELIGALIAACPDRTVLARVAEEIGPEIAEACVARAEAEVDEEVVTRAIGRVDNWAIRDAARFHIGRPLTPGEQREVARRLVERGLGTNAISRACRVAGGTAKQLHQEVTAA